MAANALGFIKTSKDLEQLSINNRPMSLVIVGETGDLADVANASVAMHNIKAVGTQNDLVLPAGYAVYRTDVRVVTAITSADPLTTVALGTDLAGKSACFNSAEVVAEWAAADALITGNTTVNHTVSKTTPEIATYTVGVNVLTAGKLLVYYNLYATKA